MNNLHVGIVLDGNRRFAKRLMKQPWKGHEHGAKKVKKLFDWTNELNIKELTLYCLSLENFYSRSRKEFSYLMNLFEKELNDPENLNLIIKNKIKVRFIGKINLLNKKLQKLIKSWEDKSKNLKNYKINFAVAYGGRQEIIDAIKKLIEKKGKINEKNFQANLWLKDEPDLIIRTGGEKRTSNFLPWQSAYSEWIFLDKMWPELTKEDLIACMDEFKNRKRRFGE